MTLHGQGRPDGDDRRRGGGRRPGDDADDPRDGRSPTFTATGKRVERTPAKGAVRWTNCDPTSPYRIPSGTVVRTSSGTGFATDEGVFLPVAILSGGGVDAQARVPDERGGRHRRRARAGRQRAGGHDPRRARELQPATSSG